jgi:hypothetical protein
LTVEGEGEAWIPGYAEGRPLPPRPGGAKGEAKEQLLRAWAGAFLASGGEPSAAGALMLEDLARYCHGRTTTAKADPTGRADPIASAVAEGRRQVLLLILARLGRTQRY